MEYVFQSCQWIGNGFVIMQNYSKRWIRIGILANTVNGLANGTHTFYWAALAVGETEVE